MKRKLMTISTVALIGASAAFAQNVTETPLNEEVYQAGIATLTAENFGVSTVKQEANGNLIFEAENDGMYRMYVLDAEGNVVSDEMGEDMAGFEYTPETNPDEISVNATQDTELLPDGGRELNVDGDVEINGSTETEAGAGAERLESPSDDGEVSADRNG